MTDFTDESKPNNPEAAAPKPPAIVPLSGRRRMLWLIGVPTAAAIIAALIVWKFPDVNVWQVPEGPLFLACFGVAFAGLAAIFLTWRCPVCGGYLGRDAHPETCPKCGVFFED